MGGEGAQGVARARTAAAAMHTIFGRGTAAEAGGDGLGVDFLIDAPTAAEASAAGGTSAGSGYELTTGTTDRLPRMLGGWARALPVTQEFGTVWGPRVLRGMAIERAEWLFRPVSAGAECGGSAIGAAAARDIFYVREATWQRRVVRRGVRVAAQALEALATAPDLVPPLPA